MARLGVRVHRLRPLDLPQTQRRGQTHRGQVVYVDRFGNLVTNLPGELLNGARVSVRCRNRAARVVRAYHEGQPRELVALVGSLGLIELVIRNDSASKRLAASPGERVMVQGR